MFKCVICYNILFIYNHYSSPPTWSTVSVVFVFSASKNGFAPVPPNLVAVDWSWCIVVIMSKIHVLFLFFTVHIQHSKCSVCLQWFHQVHESRFSRTGDCLLCGMIVKQICFWSLFVLTRQAEFCDCCVCHQQVTQSNCSWLSNIVVFFVLNKVKHKVLFVSLNTCTNCQLEES